MDVFVEQIVRKKFGPKDYLVVLGCILGGCLVIYLSIFFLTQIFVVVIAGVCFGAYYLITSRNLEFEYSVTNGDLTIDKIINRRSRKRILSLDCKQVEAIGEYKPQDHANKHYDKKIVTSVYDDGRNAWYLDLRHPKHGHIIVIFSPNERVLESVQSFIPRQVAFEAGLTGKH